MLAVNGLHSAKAVLLLRFSRNPAALVQTGKGLIRHKNAAANYQQTLSDHKAENRDNPHS